MSNVRSDPGLVNGDSSEVGGIDPNTIVKTYTFKWQQGDDTVVENTRPDQGDLDCSKFADDHDIAVGDVVTIRSTPTPRTTVTDVGALSPRPSTRSSRA